MSTIFLSHSSANNAAAIAIASWLEENGWGDYFLDVSAHQGIAPGQRWQESLKTATDRCEAVVLLISPAWRDSRWCLAEFLLAKQLGKKIFGVLVEATPRESLPAEMTAEWQLGDLVTGTERHTFRVRVEPSASEIQVSFAAEGLRRLKIGLNRAGLDPKTFTWPPAHDPERAPYRGLKALEADDAAVFFGRDVAISRGLDALRQIRDRGVDDLFVILGASGAGKSSYLRAGLWPRLARDDRAFLPLPVIRPQGAALNGPTGLVASIEAALRERKMAQTRAELRRALGSPGGLAQLLAALQDRVQSDLDLPASPTVVLSIDQGEELFISEGREESEAFLVALAHAFAGARRSPHMGAARVIATVAIRSDAYNRLQSAPQLSAATHMPFNLSPISPAEFKHIITGPAERAAAAGRSLTVDPVLTERLLRDADGADALPLLAFALERLYVDYGGDGRLSDDDYDALGGVRGAIEAAVEAAFSDPGRQPIVPFDRTERDRLLRRAFIPWLARIDPETEQRRRRVADWDELPSDSHGVVERLIAARLLVRDRRPRESGGPPRVVVEVAHEALLRQWPTLTGWLDEDADRLKAADAVGRAAAEWLKNDRGVTWLVHGRERLQAAEALASRPDLVQLMGDAGRDYLRACRSREEAAQNEREAQLARVAEGQKNTAKAQRRSRRLLAAIALVLLAFAGWTVRQSRGIGRQTSQVLVVASEEALGKGLYDRALRFAVLASRATWLSPNVPIAEVQLARSSHTFSETARLTHPGAAVNAVAFAPDGQRLATAATDNTARIWDARTGLELVRVTHDGNVTALAFSPDGQRLITASADRTARISDAQTGSRLAVITHDGEVFAVAVSADGRLIATASQDRTARVVDARTGGEIARITHGMGVKAQDSESMVYDYSVTAVAFNPDSTRLLTSSLDKTARISDVQTGSELVRMAHDGLVASAAFSPDGTRIVTTMSHGPARVFRADTGDEIADFALGDEVGVAAFSRDGQRVLIGRGDGTAVVIDAESAEPIAEIAHDAAVSAMALTSDGQRLVSGSSDGVTRVSEVDTGRELARITHDERVTSIVVSPDGTTLVTASWDGTARLFDSRIGMPLARIAHKHDDGVTSIAFSSARQRMAVAGVDGTVVVADVERGTAIAQISHRAMTRTLGVTETGITIVDNSGAYIHSAAFSPDGERIVTASRDRTARVFDADTGVEITRVSHGDQVYGASFSPDGHRLLTNSLDGTAVLSDATNGKEIFKIAHGGAVYLAVFNGDGQRIVTASEDKTARVLDATTGNEIARVTHEDGVTGAAFSPDGQRIVTASGRAGVISDARSGRPIARIAHNDHVRIVTFTPAGRHVITATNPGLTVARVSDAVTGTQVAEIPLGDAPESVAFTRDGQRLFMVTSGTAHVVDVGTWKEIRRFSNLRAAVLSPEGTRLVTSTKDIGAEVWDVTWLTRDKAELNDAVCGEKLVGTRRLSAADVEASPVLAGRADEDVCEPRMALSRFARSLRSFFR